MLTGTETRKSYREGARKAVWTKDIRSGPEVTTVERVFNHAPDAEVVGYNSGHRQFGNANQASQAKGIDAQGRPCQVHRECDCLLGRVACDICTADNQSVFACGQSCERNIESPGRNAGSKCNRHTALSGTVKEIGHCWTEYRERLKLAGDGQITRAKESVVTDRAQDDQRELRVPGKSCDFKTTNRKFGSDFAGRHRYHD